MLLFKYFNNKYKKTNFYKNQFLDVEKFLGAIPRNLEIVNLGSTSPKFAFDYSECDLLGMNWAIEHQTFEYDFRVLKQYHSFLKERAFVLIPICPLNFFFYRFVNNSANYKFYKFLDPTLIINYSKKTKLLHIDYPILTAKRNLIRIIYKDVPTDNRLAIERNPMRAEELRADAQKWVNGWLKLFKLDSFENIALSEENKNSIDKNIAVLSEMIDFCLERKFQPILMMAPVTKELGDLFPQSFIDEHILGYIKKANTKNVPVLNYMQDERFTSPDLYLNAFLFNKNGRKIFTKTVVDKLKR
jgi:hypothetical protein